MKALQHDNLITHSRMGMTAGGIMGLWEFIMHMNWLGILSFLLAAAGLGVTWYYTQKKTNHELRLKEEAAEREREYHEARMAEFRGACKREEL